ncbi:hypothetical protein D3C75_1063690 [compost metagenome]
MGNGRTTRQRCVLRFIQDGFFDNDGIQPQSAFAGKTHSVAAAVQLNAVNGIHIEVQLVLRPGIGRENKRLRSLSVHSQCHGNRVCRIVVVAEVQGIGPANIRIDGKLRIVAVTAIAVLGVPAGGGIDAVHGCSCRPG